jgi:hypothetical protein
MINLLVDFAVLVIVFALLFWIVGQVKFPEPVGKVLNIIIVVFAAIFLIVLLLQLPTLIGGTALWPRR